ncbi:MAG: cytochrome c maturation protein CcmE [Planctomycetota bacterium]|jgi:cytochrome c-type biogenesis protein CcmE
MKKNTIIKAVVAVVLIGGSMVYLIYQVAQSPFSYYYSVDEFSMKKDIAKKNSVRLAGKVGKGTVKRDVQQMLLEFILTGEKNTLAVNYKGVVPDNFADDIEVVVEGQLGDSDVFEAKKVMTRCESKYKAKVK